MILHGALSSCFFLETRGNDIIFSLFRTQGPSCECDFLRRSTSVSFTGCSTISSDNVMIIPTKRHYLVKCQICFDNNMTIINRWCGHLKINQCQLVELEIFSCSASLQPGHQAQKTAMIPWIKWCPVLPYLFLLVYHWRILKIGYTQHIQKIWFTMIEHAHHNLRSCQSPPAR